MSLLRGIYNSHHAILNSVTLISITIHIYQSLIITTRYTTDEVAIVGYLSDSKVRRLRSDLWCTDSVVD